MSKIKAAGWAVPDRMPTLEIELKEMDPVYKIKKLLLIQERLNLEIQRLNDKLEGGDGHAERMGTESDFQTSGDVCVVPV